MPRSESAAAVAGPMAATLVCENALASFPAAARRSNTTSTPFLLVRMTQSKLVRSASAASSTDVSASGFTAIVGSSTASAPCAVSKALSVPACVRERVTSTRLPKSGVRSNQRRAGLRAAVPPMTVTTGDVIPASLPLCTMSASVPLTERWFGSVPHWVTVAGVSGERPSTSSVRTIAGRLCHPISTTSVPPTFASAFQSTWGSGLAGSSEPVTTVNAAAMSRCVTGTPA